MKKTLITIAVVALCVVSFAACGNNNAVEEQLSYEAAAETATRQTDSDGESATDAAGAQATATDDKEPLTYGDEQAQQAATNSVAYVTVDGTTEQYDLSGLVDRNQNYYAFFKLTDSRGNCLSTLSLAIPKRGQPGDTFRYDDPINSNGNGNVLYTPDAGSDKRYAAYNKAQMAEYAKSGLEKLSYRDGNKYVITIDDVSDDGNIISGRFIASFVGCGGDPTDFNSVTIDESSFVIYASDAD